MKFFTDKTVENPYLLIKLKDYLKFNIRGNWKEVFIDPGVYELTKQPYYSWEKNLDIEEFLQGLPDNHYFSADYPCDMNENYTDEFLLKSWDNAVKYCQYPNYIVTVQFKFNNCLSFMRWFDRYNELTIESGIMGLGNLCRIFYNTEYMKHVLPYAFSKCKHKRIHIYGCALRLIPIAYRLAKKYKIELSVDSTKWTRCCTNELKEAYGLNCSTHNRQEFFDNYIKILRERGVPIDF